MKLFRIAIVVFGMTTLALAGVNVSSPTPNSQDQSSVHFVASASGNYPIVAMMIYSDNQSISSINKANLDASGSILRTAITTSWFRRGTAKTTYIRQQAFQYHGQRRQSQ